MGGGLWLALGAASTDLLVDTAAAPEPGWLRGPLAGAVPGITNTAFSLALALMTVGYAGLVAWGDRLPAVALAAVAAVALALALDPVLMSSDAFHYLGFARLSELHGLNPYRHTIAAAPRDPVVGLVYWQHITTPYGPLFTVASFPLAHVGVASAIWALKGAAALGWGVAVAAAWRAAPRWGAQPLRAALVVGANPLVLAYGVGGAHNELVVLALVLAGLAVLGAGRARSAGAALAAAAAIKVTGGIALALGVLGAPERRRLLTGALLVGLPAMAVAVVWFGPHVFAAGLGNATSREFAIDWSGPDVIGRALGTGISAGVRVGFALAVAVAAVAVARAMRNGMPWLVGAGWLTVALLCSIASLVPWYVAWALPMAALGSSRRLVWAAVALTAAVAVTHLPALGFAAYE